MEPRLRILDRPRVVQVAALTTYPFVGVLALAGAFLTVTATFVDVGAIEVDGWRYPRGIAAAMGLVPGPPALEIAVEVDAYEVSAWNITPWRARWHDRRALTLLLRGLADERHDLRSVLVRAGEGVRYQQMIDVAAACRAANLEVQIELEPERRR